VTTALITGAGGFIAQHLAGILRREGTDRVVGFDVRGMSATLFDDRRSVDLTDAEATNHALAVAKPNVIFHLVGGIRGSDAFVVGSNVDTARNVIEAVRVTVPSARVVLVGSAAEYGIVPLAQQPVTETFVGSPVGVYGKAKAQVSALAAAAAHDFGQHVCVARPFNVIGAGVPDSLVAGAVVHRMRLAVASTPPRRIKIGRTSGIRDFVAAEDVAFGLIRIADRGRPGQAYNLCSGQGRSIAELVEKLLFLAGEPIEVERDESLSRTDDVDVMVGSFAKAKRELEWQPSVSFERSLRAAWMASESITVR
jgi:GDP-4-dehydro-6-deoxy-D-mannose reductase